MGAHSSKKIRSLKIVVYEHISGGGCAGQPMPSDLLAEGFGMMRCLVADLKAAGHEITVLIDERLSKLSPQLDADCTIPIFYPEEQKKFLENIVRINDAAYIIAPETGQTLQKLIKSIEKTGKISLNCKSDAFSMVGDKSILYDCLRDKGLPTPKSMALESDCSLNEVQKRIKEEFEFPVVLKPVDGVGCCGLSIIENKRQIEPALLKIKNFSKSKRFIIQEYVKGSSASVSLLSNGQKALAISLNEQKLNLCGANAESNYFGGCVQLNHSLKDKALVLAEKVVESFDGLWGYIGIDLVLTKNEVFIVDVNARLTTSFIGVRKVVGFNVADALVNAVTNGELPMKIEDFEENRTVCFQKIETIKPSIAAFQQITQLGNTVSPPFPIENNYTSYTLIIGEGTDYSMAKLNLEEAKKRIIEMLS